MPQRPWPIKLETFTLWPLTEKHQLTPTIDSRKRSQNFEVIKETAQVAYPQREGTGGTKIVRMFLN